MALSHKLELRQSQSLVMTPQLMQAIKLLQLSNLDLVAYVDAELERNPLLERAEQSEDGAGANAPDERDRPSATAPAQNGERRRRNGWRPRLEATPTAIGGKLDTDLGNVFPGRPRHAPPTRPRRRCRRKPGRRRRRASRSAPRTTISRPSSPSEKSLADHLADQLGLAVADPAHAADRPGADQRDRRGRLSARRPRRRSPSGSARRRSMVERALAAHPDASSRPASAPATSPNASPSSSASATASTRRWRRWSTNLDLVARRDHAALMQALRRRRGGPRRHARRAPRAQSEARRRLRRRPVQPVIPDVLVAPGAGRRLAGRAQFRHAAARAGQPDLLRHRRRAADGTTPTRPTSPTACRPPTGWSRASTSAPGRSSRSRPRSSASRTPSSPRASSTCGRST